MTKKKLLVRCSKKREGSG